MHLILLSIGSRTPFSILFLTFPLTRSKPVCFNLTLSALVEFWAAKCKTFNLETSSVASYAALIARVFGMIAIASAYSAIAVCSLLARVLATSSKCVPTAISTEPPPATTNPDSNVLLTTHKESWRDLFYMKISKNNEFFTFKFRHTCIR